MPPSLLPHAGWELIKNGSIMEDKKSPLWDLGSAVSFQ